jgi:lipopolysaccharide transport system ATP-binding protein
MDEWLSVGDEGFKEKAEARLSSIISSTKILILASHSYELLRTNCSRILWLEHGNIKMDGKPDDVLPHYFKVDKTHPS